MPVIPHTHRKIGLALGSGGARGWAHVGVLQRLNSLGIPIHCVAGTSIGSVVGALYASDSLETLEDLATQLDWRHATRLFLEVNFPRSGLLSGKNFMSLLHNVIPVHAISALKIPFAAVATDIQTEKEVVLSSGSIFDALRASIAIPGIFTPMRLQGRNLVDGGLVNPLPVSVCRAMGADFVNAVDINLRSAPLSKRKQAKRISAPAEPSQRMEHLIANIGKLMPQLQTPMEEAVKRWTQPQKKDTAELSIFDVLTRSFRLIENQITRHQLAINPPDIRIQPEVGHIMTLEFHRGPETIAAGARAVNEALPQLLQLLTPNA